MSQFKFNSGGAVETDLGYFSNHGSDHVLWGAGIGNMRDPANAFNVYSTPTGAYVLQSRLKGLYLGQCANSDPEEGLACFTFADPSQVLQIMRETNSYAATFSIYPTTNTTTSERV
jgi:hypothetical protein